MPDQSKHEPNSINKTTGSSSSSNQIVDPLNQSEPHVPVPTREQAQLLEIQSSAVTLDKTTKAIATQLGDVAKTLKTISETSASTARSERLENGVEEIRADLRSITELGKSSASKVQLDEAHASWATFQNEIIKRLGGVVTDIQSAESTFNHSVKQLNEDTTTRFEVLFREEKRRTASAEDRILESIIFPLHDAAYRISSDIESGGKIAEAPQVCGLLETLESNLRDSLHIHVFRPKSGEEYRSDCMKPVDHEKTRLFFRRPDTVANTRFCGFYREGDNGEDRFLRKAQVVVYRDDRSQAIPDSAPNPTSDSIERGLS
jgi:hypothetical protein